MTALKQIYSSAFPLVTLSILLMGCVPKSQLEKAQTDLADAQAKIKSLEHDVATTHEALGRAEAELSQFRPPAANAGALPITTRLRRHGTEFQLAITNQSKAPLRLNITVSAVGRWITAAPIIDGEGEWHLPQLQTGDVVEIASDGYASQKITVQ